METITEIQFNNLISSPDSAIINLPAHIQSDIESLRSCTKNGKAHLLLTQYEDCFYLEYVEVDALCPEEIAEANQRAKESNGHFIAV
jgi:hypothetical protein